MNAPRLLLCCDLDRTLLPNGAAPESPDARAAFARLAARPDVTLAYVTGRHPALMEAGLAEYDLPLPDVAVTDVGTRIRSRERGSWRPWPEWEALIADDWAGHDNAALHALLHDLPELTLQPLDRQAPHKLSYDLPGTTEPVELLAEARRRLASQGVNAALVFSVDDAARHGLLDVLPASATKLHAVRFVALALGFAPHELLYAGDSGNDLPVLVSELPAVLVANATDDVRRAARAGAEAAGTEHALHLAVGGHAGRNGNYAAGVLEGVARFHPAFDRPAAEEAPS